MKVIATEYDGAFTISLEAEDLKDASFITRVAIGAKKEMASRISNAYRDGNFGMHIRFVKKKNASFMIGK